MKKNQLLWCISGPIGAVLLIILFSYLSSSKYLLIKTGGFLLLACALVIYWLTPIEDRKDMKLELFKFCIIGLGAILALFSIKHIQLESEDRYAYKKEIRQRRLLAKIDFYEQWYKLNNTALELEWDLLSLTDDPNDMKSSSLPKSTLYKQEVVLKAIPEVQYAVNKLLPYSPQLQRSWKPIFNREILLEVCKSKNSFWALTWYFQCSVYPWAIPQQKGFLGQIWQNIKGKRGDIDLLKSFQEANDQMLKQLNLESEYSQ